MLITDKLSEIQYSYAQSVVHSNCRVSYFSNRFCDAFSKFTNIKFYSPIKMKIITLSPIKPTQLLNIFNNKTINFQCKFNQLNLFNWERKNLSFVTMNVKEFEEPRAHTYCWFLIGRNWIVDFVETSKEIFVLESTERYAILSKIP